MAASAGFAQTLVYLAYTVTVNSTEGFGIGYVTNQIVLYKNALAGQLLVNPSVIPMRLTALGIDCSWEANRSVSRLQAVIRGLWGIDRAGTFPLGFTKLRLGFREHLQESLRSLGRNPRVPLNSLSQYLMMRQPRRALYSWANAENWSNWLNPMGEYFCHVLNHPRVRPPMLEPLNPLGTQRLAHHLLAEQTQRLGLPSNILLFHST